MIVIDLPEPRKIEITPEERLVRQRKVISALLWLVVGYAFIHKIGVPLVLKFTRLSTSPYAEIDLWFFWPLALALALRRKEFSLASFLAGGGILYAFVDIVLSVRGVYPGWLGISKILSAAPFGGVCIAFLTGPFPERVTRSAWFGVIAIALTKALLLTRSLW